MKRTEFLLLKANVAGGIDDDDVGDGADETIPQHPLGNEGYVPGHSKEQADQNCLRTLRL